MVRVKEVNRVLVVYILTFVVSYYSISAKKSRKLQIEINSNSQQGFTLYKDKNAADYYESKKGQNKDLICLIRYKWSNITKEMMEVNLTLNMKNETYHNLKYISNITEIVIRRTNIINNINRTLSFYTDLCKENNTYPINYTNGKEAYFKRTSLVEVQRFPELENERIDFEGSWAYFKLNNGSYSSFKESFIKENDQIIYRTNNKKTEGKVTQDTPVIRRFDYDKKEGSKSYCNDVVRNVSLFLRQSNKNHSQYKIISRKLIKILGNLIII